MQHLDDGTIHAWIDGALHADRAREVDAHLAECESCASAVAEARGLIAAASRILSTLDVVPDRVMPEPRAAAPERATSARSTSWPLRAARIAAVIAIGVIGATVWTRIERPMQHDEQLTQSMEHPMQRVGEAVGATVGKIARDTVAASANTSAPATHEPAPAARESAPATHEPSPAAQPRLPAHLAPRTDASPRLVTTEFRMTPDAHMVRRRVYEVRPGVRITLEDVRPSRAYTEFPAEPVARRAEARTLAPQAASADALGAGATPTMPRAAAAPGAPAATTPAVDSTAARLAHPGINTIQWTDSAGTRFTLSGPLSVEALEALKARLP
ncbi:MAG TPA: zf-HC2 domain-containing protein [Gemmatimonadaceae bacterium]